MSYYPIARIASVLEAAGCSNAAVGALALVRDKETVDGLHRALKGMPEPGTPMDVEERQHWISRFEAFLDVYAPAVSAAQGESATGVAEGVTP